MTDPISPRAVLPIWLHLFYGIALRRPHRASAIAYWYLTRRTVRARNRLREAAADLLPVYKTWITSVERPEIEHCAADGSARGRRPRFSLLLHVPAWTDGAAFDRSLAAIRRQTFGDWEAIVTGRAESAAAASEADPRIRLVQPAGGDRAGALAPALAAARGDFVIVLPPDAILPAVALARYRDAADDAPDAKIFYGDEDGLNAEGRRVQPWFKPKWNAELVLAQDYVSRACAIDASLARTSGPIAAELAGCAGYAALLAATRQPVEVRHVAHILCHLPESAPRDDPEVRRRTVERHLGALAESVEVGRFGTIRVHWRLPEPPPSVTIIIPTRDCADLLEACVGSLLRETRYPNYDVVIVDNGSIEPRTHAWFEAAARDPRVSVLGYDHPYNYSAINNFAAAQAKGHYLCLLNNDTEIIDGAWLEELMRYATRPEIGAVGAKLLYDDRSIQHAGVVVGLGNAAGHAHRALADDDPGYFALAHSAHYASAVTAACLVVARAKFDAVGGLDATDLRIAYNDVDFCLKLQQAGWRNVYAPQAVLIHHESKSRGLDISPQHVERYRQELAVLQDRWGTAQAIDPMHHPRLDRSSESYRIRL